MSAQAYVTTDVRTGNVAKGRICMFLLKQSNIILLYRNPYTSQYAYIRTYICMYMLKYVHMYCMCILYVYTYVSARNWL